MTPPHNHYSLKDGRPSVLSAGYSATPDECTTVVVQNKSGEGRAYDTSLGGYMKTLALGDLVFNTWHAQLL